MSNKNKNKEGIVYSTDKDFDFSLGANLAEDNTGQKQELKIHLEKNHRGGKTVSIIRGFKGSEQTLESLGSDLKKICGSGGSVKNGEILIQGDFRDKILAYLVEQGHKVKKAGA